MHKFSMTCTCGHEMSQEAANRDEAVSKMKAMMDENAIAQHMTEKHAGEIVPSMQTVHAMIEQNMKEAA